MPVDPRRLLDEAMGAWTHAQIASPQVDAELLLAHVTGRPRGAVRLMGEVSDDDALRYRELIEARTTRPLQHLTGRAPFRLIELDVGPGVFIPRPETELLAGIAIDEVQRLHAAGVARPRVIDLCSGSGAVALAIASEEPECEVMAVELLESACDYLQRNIARIAPRVEMVRADIFGLRDLCPELDNAVDIVVANPPYIPLSEFESVPREVRDHDPALALWSGDDGLDATRTVAEVAAWVLVDGGLVASEHADVQGESAPRVFVEQGAWQQVRDLADLAGRPRHVVARRRRRESTDMGRC